MGLITRTISITVWAQVLRGITLIIVIPLHKTGIQGVLPVIIMRQITITTLVIPHQSNSTPWNPADKKSKGDQPLSTSKKLPTTPSCPGLPLV